MPENVVPTRRGGLPEGRQFNHEEHEEHEGRQSAG